MYNYIVTGQATLGLYWTSGKSTEVVRSSSRPAVPAGW